MFDYIAGNFPQLMAAGTLGYLIKTMMSHFLAKSRNNEKFKNKVDHESSEKKKITLSFLGELSNGILNCWEEGALNVTLSKSLSKNSPRDILRKLSFEKYSEIKSELIKHDLFTPSMWHNLDRFPESVSEINKLIHEKHPSDLHAQLYWFAEMCESYWAIVADAYINNGGELKNLTKPMPVKYK